MIKAEVSDATKQMVLPLEAITDLSIRNVDVISYKIALLNFERSLHDRDRLDRALLTALL